MSFIRGLKFKKKIASLQIKKIYNFGDPFMPTIKLMDPIGALSFKTRNEYNSI